MISQNPEKHLIIGSDLSEVARTGAIPRVTTQLMRLLCLLVLCSMLVIWTTGFLRQEVAVISLVIILLLIRGRAFVRGRLLLQLMTLPVLMYGVAEYKSGVPGILVLLQFTSIIIALQTMILVNGRSALGTTILSLMIVVGVAAMNINFKFPVALLPYLFVLAAVLREMASLMHRTIAIRSLTVVRTGYLNRSRSCFSVAIALLLFFSFWMIFFYIIPRTKSFGIASEISRRKMKGFSDSLQIGSGGLLEDNPAVMLRVKPLEERTQSFALRRRLQHRYLRGTSFYDYENGSWSRSRARRWGVDLQPGNGIMRFPSEDYADYRNIHAVEIIMENIEPPVVFIPDQTVSAEFDSNYMVIEDDKTVFFPRRNPGRRRYLVQMALEAQEVKDALVSSIQLPHWQQFYLSSDGITPRLQELANDLASGTLSISQRVESIRKLLHETTEYSLVEISAGEMDPVEHFLFVSQAGTCEHYASAMTLLLRAMNIPARPVSGFTFGEWNDSGKFFTIRQRHAHAWVELFYPGHGWVTYDPTPGDALESGFEVSEGVLRDLWETYEGFWFTYIYNFDNQIQYSGFRRLMNTLPEYLDFIMLMVFNVYSAILFAVLGLTYYVARAREKRFVSGQYAWIPDWYRNWETQLSLKRKLWQTPGEFHSELFASGLISKSDLVALRTVEKTVESYLVSQNRCKILEDEAKQILAQLII